MAVYNDGSSTNAYLEIPHDSAWNVGDFTVVFRIRVPDSASIPSAASRILWQGASDSLGNRFAIFISTTGGGIHRLNVRVGANPASIVHNYQFPDAWVTVAVSLDVSTTTARLYLNGEFIVDGSEPDAPPSTTASMLLLGTTVSFAAFPLEVHGEDFRLYDRCLTDAEIMEIHAAGGADLILDGLVGRWLAVDLETGAQVPTTQGATAFPNLVSPGASLDGVQVHTGASGQWVYSPSPVRRRRPPPAG